MIKEILSVSTNMDTHEVTAKCVVAGDLKKTRQFLNLKGLWLVKSENRSFKLKIIAPVFNYNAISSSNIEVNWRSRRVAKNPTLRIDYRLTEQGDFIDLHGYYLFKQLQEFPCKTATIKPSNASPPPKSLQKLAKKYRAIGEPVMWTEYVPIRQAFPPDRVFEFQPEEFIVDEDRMPEDIDEDEE